MVISHLVRIIQLVIDFFDAVPDLVEFDLGDVRQGDFLEFIQLRFKAENMWALDKGVGGCICVAGKLP